MQLRAIFGLAKKRNLDSHELRDLAEAEFHKRSIGSLTFDQANKLIKLLGGTPLLPPQSTPLRTQQYHRRQAGVVQIVNGSQLDLIASLARRRGWTEESLAKFCKRLLKGKSKPITTVDANKVIEALKAMNIREGLL
jgi:hypothetical protein